jgi:hypothetical protein
MARRKTPRPLFKQRRPASARLESVESVAFRKALGEIEAEERRASSLRFLGLEPDCDIAALAALCERVGYISVGGRPVLGIEPIGEWDDDTEFDRRMFAAGLRAYVRRPLSSETYFRGNFVCVASLEDGNRMRAGIGDALDIYETPAEVLEAATNSKGPRP